MKIEIVNNYKFLGMYLYCQMTYKKTHQLFIDYPKLNIQ